MHILISKLIINESVTYFVIESICSIFKVPVAQWIERRPSKP